MFSRDSMTLSSIYPVYHLAITVFCISNTTCCKIIFYILLYWSLCFEILPVYHNCTVLSRHLLRFCSQTQFVPYQTFSAFLGTILHFKSFGLQLGTQTLRSFVTCRWSFKIERVTGALKPKIFSIWPYIICLFYSSIFLTSVTFSSVTDVHGLPVISVFS